MPGLTCNACNKEFEDDAEQKLHYKSEWHRYNLKRKGIRAVIQTEKAVASLEASSRCLLNVAGVPGVTEALFLARQAALAQEKKKSSQTPMLYSCGICGKGYRSDKAHAQHLQSRSHILRASQGVNLEDGEKTIIRPLAPRVQSRPAPQKESGMAESEDSEDEWEEVDSEDDLVGEAANSLSEMNVDEPSTDHHMEDGSDDDDFCEVDPSCCFICDREHDSIELCMVHMHKQHGFFIPDVEYLKDPEGLLTYLGLKVKRDLMCLYCNERCHPFSSLEAVRKHMTAKSHCKVHFGDGDDDEEAELEEFYDYSSSYVDEDGKQLVASGDMGNSVELGSGGSELVITRRSDGGVSMKTLGSREYLRYYRQKPRPSTGNNAAITAALASRYRSMGLTTTVRSREQMVRLKVIREMNRSGVEAMRTKIGMKSNVIRNLPKNVTH